MENNPGGGKPLDSPKDNSTHNIQRLDGRNQKVLTTSKSSAFARSSPAEHLTVTRDDKMNNIAKLRQQFIDEIKDVVLSLKETTKNLQMNIAKIKKKEEIIQHKLKNEYNLLCKQSQIIYDKEQENKILRLKIEELYGYQKMIVENLEDINTTVSCYEALSDGLTNDYDSVLVMQQNDNRSLKEELSKITPDKKFCFELNQLNLSINEMDKEIVKYKNENEVLNLKVKEVKKYKEEDQNKIKELDKRLNELEIKRKNSKDAADTKKKDLIQDVEKLKREINTKAKEVAELDKQFSEFNNKLEEARNHQNKTEEKTKNINDEMANLLLENEKLDQMLSHKDQENTTNLEKLQEKLKVSQSELESIKQKENLATNVLQKKISEMHTKLMSYQNIESKLEKVESNMKKEEEMIEQINQECERKKLEVNEKTKLDDKINEMKGKIHQMECKASQSKEKIDVLREEIRKMTENYESQLQEMKSYTDKLTKVTSHYNLPHLFVSEDTETGEKQKNRRKLYTPTFEDEELEIDSMPIDEQFDHLTQSNSSSQPESPDKQKKFFKRTTNIQPQVKNASTPRNKGKNKKY